MEAFDGDTSSVSKADRSRRRSLGDSGLGVSGADKVHNITTDQVFDYTRKRGVEHAEIVLPTAAIANRYGVAVDLAIHAPHRAEDERLHM